MNGDTFISSKDSSNYEFNPDEDNNFFLKTGDIPMSIPEQEPLRHLNDYDSNILKEEAYKDVSNELFKLEYKISRAEEEIKELNKKISAAYDIYDYFLADSLSTRKNQLEIELQELIQKYKDSSLSSKISGNITSKFKGKYFKTKNFMSSILEFFVSRVPGKLSSFFEIKNSLNKLENISKSVDELMKVQYPYGESESRYEQLSKYIAKANSLHANITKFIK